MDRHDAVALLGLEESGRRAPGGIGGERRGADGLEDRAGHPEPGGLSVVGELRALVRLRLARVRQVEVAHPEEPLHLGLDVDVGQTVAHVRLLGERHAVALGLLAIAQQAIPHAVPADAAAAAVLELEMRRRDCPALVLAADQRERRHADVVEEHGLLHARIGAALAAGAHQLHGLHRDARQARVDHEPREVLVALALRVGVDDHPDPVGPVVAADEDLLALDHVLVAVAHRRRHPHAGQVGARAGLGQELPGPDLAPIDRGQERLALLLGAPDQDRRRAEAPTAVVVGRQGEIEAVDLFLEDDRVVDIEAAAAVLRRRRGIEPALHAELTAEVAQLEIAPVVVLGGDRRAQHRGRNVRLEPRAHFTPKPLLLLGVRDLEIHTVSSHPPWCLGR
jgi:hypothetical protein